MNCEMGTDCTEEATHRLEVRYGDADEWDEHYYCESHALGRLGEFDEEDTVELLALNGKKP